METETCKCGHTVKLDESTLRLGAQTVGCFSCDFTGRPVVRLANEATTTTTTNIGDK